MKSLVLVTALFIAYITVYSKGFENNGGFIFTAPKRFFSGNNERVCISFLNTTQYVNVHVAVEEEKGHSQIASVDEGLDIQNGGKCFNISIPRTKSKKGRLSLSISFPAEDYSINYYEQILIQSSPDVVYILTDKPIYSGGHTVKFRIFIIRSDLTPVDEYVDKIWVENPNGVHLAQWLNESTTNSFIDKSFQLSEEPLTGVWYIKVKRKFEDVTSQRFMVENYVLPRFAVSLGTPKHVNVSSHFNVTVCAKYTFGEPVHGTVHLHLYIKCSFSFYCLSNRASLREQLRLDRQGCISHRFRFNNVTSFAQKIVVNATVRESGTGIEGTTAAGIEIKTPIKGNGLEFSSLTKQKRFKPGLPFKGQVLQKSSVSPDVMLCFDVSNMKSCSQIRLKDGGADFILSPVLFVDEKNFSAYIEINEVSKYEENGVYNTKLSLVPWYSPSGSYVQLEDLSKGVLKCNRTASFNVIFSTSNMADIPMFYYLVKSKGSIITDGMLTPSAQEVTDFTTDNATVIGAGNFTQVKQFKMFLNVGYNLSPNSHLLIYYIRRDGEVVADTLTLNVAKCLKNSVITQWRKNISLPGDMNQFKIKADPNSVCAISVTDRSIKMLQRPAELNKEAVFKSFRKLDSDSDSPANRNGRCWNANENSEDEQSSFLNFPETDSRFVDSHQAFEDFGAIVISNLEVQTRPCKDQWRTEKSMRNSSGQVDVRINGNEAENMVQLKKSDIMKVISKQREMSFGYELRNFFPETWIWDIINISESGTGELDIVIPHTITEWESEAICLSKQSGIGIAEVKRMTAYQPFFLDFAVPHSMKRKETFYLSVSVFNYEDDNIPIKITYTPSNKFVMKKGNSESYCVKSKSKVVHKFVLEPTQLGEAVITVMAEVDTDFEGKCEYAPVRSMRDTVSKKTVIKHEGFPTEEVKSGFICGDNINFESEVSWNVKIPVDIVETSLSMNGLVSGDILGPSLKNIDKLVTLPTGCGEQNMILLAPNILILEYLLLTRPDEAELIEKALKNLDLGYQKQLNYRLSDGSYSAFGEKDEKGSIWLTAFVVRYISQAQKFVHIDKADLNVSVQWILRHQLENGCFPVVGKIYHRDLKGKFSENDSSKPLTAYIIISLIESGLVEKSTPFMKNAIFCLKGIEQSSGTYGDLLATYALLMVGEVREAQALMFELLKSAKRVYGLLWWENDQDSSIESSVEMTAYGILCLLRLGGSHFTAAASDAVKWITQYRNRNGGFVSSQDTILALEAISKLSASLPRMGDSDKLTVALETKDKNFSFDVTKDNMFLQQKISLPAYLSEARFVATGKGCALVQTQMKYNTRHGRQNNQLKLQLKIDSVSDIDLFFVTKFNICARLKSATDTIKMAVLEVFMVSGFYPDRTSLYDIPISRKGVRKWEEFEEKVVFYFEDLKQKKVCVQFLVNQEMCVEKTTPALIKLYDYYNNQHVTTVKYSLQPECNNGTGNWLNALPEEKMESKREVSDDGYHLKELYQSSSTSKPHLSDFVDVDFDLDTPQGIGPLPLYVPSPFHNTSGHDCPICTDSANNAFSGLYCSAKRVMMVQSKGEDLLEIIFDLTPRTSPKAIGRTVSFKMNEMCSCPLLKTTNSTSLIVVTPLETRAISTSQQIHLDNSAMVFPLESKTELPVYLKEAIDYCRQWSSHV